MAQAPKQVTPTNVKGFTYDQAVQALKAQGFTNIVKDSNQVASTETPAGSVVSQTPDPGAGDQSLDTQIVLTLSSGAPQSQPPATMPGDLIGQTVGAARAELQALNLNLQITVQGPAGGQPGDNAKVFRSIRQRAPSSRRASRSRSWPIGGGGGGQ